MNVACLVGGLCGVSLGASCGRLGLGASVSPQPRLVFRSQGAPSKGSIKGFLLKGRIQWCLPTDLYLISSWLGLRHIALAYLVSQSLFYDLSPSSAWNPPMVGDAVYLYSL